MKIKKFTCNNCGAPKVNAYKSPYIVCDYCGNLTDIDYTMSLQAWNADEKRAEKYQKANLNFQNKLNGCLINKNKKEYYELQVKYWDLYYRLYPEYLPPTINFEDNFYAQFLAICANSATVAAFDEEYQKVVKKQYHLQSQVEYYTEKGATKVKGESFFRMINEYIDSLKEDFKLFYDNPDYALMHKVFPYDVNLKMKVSTVVQIWLPYLNDADAKKFLKKTGFTQDYIDPPKVEGHTSNCQHCKTELFVPANALKVHCEECHKTNIIKSKFNCMSCGVENEIPEHPVNTIDCIACKIENRLIVAQFG
ncbi:MAG: hypothetical protein H0W73_16870 [Bacteroidetes bacterium]|nr:hypothetical protein [Bacteroidota bacterium]